MQQPRSNGLFASTAQDSQAALDDDSGMDDLSKTDSAGGILQGCGTDDASNSDNFETSPSGFQGTPIFIEACAGLWYSKFGCTTAWIPGDPN